MATLKTVVFVQIIPWFVIIFASAMIFPTLALILGGLGKGSTATNWLEWYPIVSTVMVAALTLGKDFLFWTMARKRLSENFRLTATQAIIPVVHRTFIPSSQKPMNVPPIPPPPPPV